MRHKHFALFLPLGVLAAVALVGGKTAWGHRQDADSQPPLPTGKRLLPQGQQTNVGSFPVNMVLSPDGKFIAVTNTGFRQYLSILSAADGHLISQLPFNPNPDDKNDKMSLYVGLAFESTPLTGTSTYRLYASRGPEDKISRFELDGAGRLTFKDDLANPSGLPKAAKSAQPNFVAHLALSQDGSRYTQQTTSPARIPISRVLSASFPRQRREPALDRQG